MRVLLDTAALILALESPQRLSRHCSALLESRKNQLDLSALSISEIAIKTGLGKLQLSWDAVRVAIEEWDVRILPYTGEHAQWMFQLPFHHADPFDRQIIAQALCESIPVVTCDETFRRYEGLKVIW